MWWPWPVTGSTTSRRSSRPIWASPWDRAASPAGRWPVSCCSTAPSPPSRRCWPKAGGSSPTSSVSPTSSSPRPSTRPCSRSSIGLSGVPFPFFPRHLTIVSTLTIGIPGFFLALAAGAPRARPGFTRRVLAFTVPAGLAAAAATLASYAIARAAPDTTAVQPRTAAMLALFAVGLWVLALIARPLDAPRISLARGHGRRAWTAVRLPRSAAGSFPSRSRPCRSSWPCYAPLRSRSPHSRSGGTSRLARQARRARHELGTNVPGTVYPYGYYRHCPGIPALT